ncbi:MAG: hypothetical protein LC753_02060 [Acidobacteria bacterium]|nr:hypothetical protein [Acidobacteriota bacterium]MCA1649089.1 hypothetical protein [Acidobacteriota bacterium]
MVWRNPLASPVRLLALFVLLAGIPLVALGWIGYQVVQQDRALESQRLRDRLDNAAALLARELDRTLSTWEDLLPAAAKGESVPLPPGRRVSIARRRWRRTAAGCVAAVLPWRGAARGVTVAAVR